MEQINVEEIMAQIRQEIKDKGYTPDMLSFKDVNATYDMASEYNHDEFVAAVNNIQVNKSITWIRNDIGGGIKGTVKRLIMKMIGFIVDYTVVGQNIYNDQVAEAFVQLQAYIEQQNIQLEQYEDRIETLESKLAAMEKN